MRKRCPFVNDRCVESDCAAFVITVEGRCVCIAIRAIYLRDATEEEKSDVWP